VTISDNDTNWLTVTIIGGIVNDIIIGIIDDDVGN